MKQYNNDLTPEILASLKEPAFTPEQIAEMPEEARKLVMEQLALQQRPVAAIYRPAVAGSLTRQGGIADEFEPDPNKGAKALLSNGQYASVLYEGCTVTYVDGTKSRIATSAGQSHTVAGKGMGLVGSLLENGDEIVSTPANCGFIVKYKDDPVPEDFLPAHEVA